jgi:RNA polymerase sigma-70 factor, ECF subfamily
MVSILDEKALAEQCRKQNRHAQKVLFDKYFNKMMTVCLRYLKSEEDALEALNNAFLKVFSKINQYKSEGSLESWIKRIVINASIDFVRSNKSYRANFIQTNEFHLYGEPGEENTLTGEGFEAPDFSKEELFEMVEELPPATRVVFNLYVIDEFSHRQISENLEISEGTSKWHLSNARKILKEKINKAVIVKNKNSNHGEETAELR